MKISEKTVFKFDPLVLFPFYIILAVILISGMFNLLHHDKFLTVYYNGSKKDDQNFIIKVKNKNSIIESFDIDEYLIGVVAAEMPPSFNYEALKAQAVAGRTYIINRKTNENNTHKDADVCMDPAHCKGYISDSEAEEKWGSDWINIYRNKISNAVYDTKGMILTYEDEPISAVFHSTNSGRTENAEDVWQTEKPYLKSVESEGEELSPRFKSTVEISIGDFKTKIKEMDRNANFDTPKNKWVTYYKYTQGGSVKTVNIGGVDFKGTEVREKFGLRSANFSIVIGDSVVFEVTGNGHGVGMSQYGANYAASKGMDYEEILKKYYPGTKLTKYY